MPLNHLPVEAETKNRRALQILSPIFPYLGMFAIILLLWLPFGFKTTGLVEEWSINSVLDTGQLLFFTPPTSNMAFYGGRPFVLFFYTLAHALDPNSFVYYNVFLMLFLFGKAVITYLLLLEFLPGQSVLAFLTGILFAIYPADSGLFSLNTLNVHSTALVYLIAAYLLVLYGKQTKGSGWLTLFGAASFLGFGMLQYPGIITIAAVTPFFLLYFGRPNRRFWIATSVWYGIMATTLLYFNWAIHQVVPGNNYDEGILQRVSLSVKELISMAEALVLAYARQVSTWFNAIGKLNYLPFFWVFVVLGLLVTGAVGWRLLRQQSREKKLDSLPRRHFVLLWIAGFMLFAISMALYMLSPGLRLQDFRVFNIAALGSALVLVLTLYFISGLFPRYRQLMLLVLAVPFIALALLSGLQQHLQFVNFSLREQNVLQEIAEQVPQITPHTPIVLIDQTGLLNTLNTFQFGTRLQAALSVLYNDPNIEAYYCLNEGKTVSGSYCQFKTDGIEAKVLNDSAPLVVIPYDRVLLFTTDYDGQIKLLTVKEAEATYKSIGYDPQSRIIGSTLPKRVAALFSCIPALSCYRPLLSIVNGTLDLSTLDERGLGWRVMEPDGKGGAFRFSVNRTSTVDINVTTNTDLDLEFKVNHWIEDDVINSLKLTVNEHDIPLTFTAEGSTARIYHTVIPHTILEPQSSNLTLMFHVDHLSPLPGGYVLGFALNWLHIRPA